MAPRLRIKRVGAYPLDVPLLAPFTIASAELRSVNNVAVAIELESGALGYGEIATLPPVTAETQSAALACLEDQRAYLNGADAGAWRRIGAELAERLPAFASVRAGIETALLDAVARSWNAPLFQFFGGTQDRIVTDITVPICAATEAERLAGEYRRAGFETIKTKVGIDVGGDLERLLAIRRVHPGCRLVLDANEGYSLEQAFEVVRAVKKAGIEIALFEQPVARADWEGMGRLTRDAGVLIAADESCRSAADALRIGTRKLAHVLNIKLVKCGVVQALEIAAVGRALGLGLMIGEMVETRLGTGFSAHFAAGSGGFEWVDLDTPLLLAEDPIRGGYRRAGAEYRLAAAVPGHGAEPLCV